jgi:hypothetical protein
MRSVDWRRWLWQYVLPIVILQLSFGLTMLLGLGGDEFDVFWFVFVMPVAAFLVGVFFRPDLTLVIPIGVVFGLWFLAMFTPGATEPIVGDLGAFFLLLGLVGLPILFLVWLGKRLRPWLEGKLMSRRDQPNLPAG